MDKRGFNFAVASFFLTLIAVLLGVMIWLNMEVPVVSLSPEVDCLGADYSANIVESGVSNYLDVVNYGKLDIEGFYVKRLIEGVFVMYEEVYVSLEIDDKAKVNLKENYGRGNYLIVPIVAGEDETGEVYFRACKDIYGEEIIIG